MDYLDGGQKTSVDDWTAADLDEMTAAWTGRSIFAKLSFAIRTLDLSGYPVPLNLKQRPTAIYRRYQNNGEQFEVRWER